MGHQRAQSTEKMICVCVIQQNAFMLCSSEGRWSGIINTLFHALPLAALTILRFMITDAMEKELKGVTRFL